MAAQQLWSSTLIGERDAFGKRGRGFLEASRRGARGTRSGSRNGRLSIRTGAKKEDVSTVKTESGGFLGRLSKSLLRNPQLNETFSGPFAQDLKTLDGAGVRIENEGGPSLLRRPQRGAPRPPFCAPRVYISNDRSLLNVDNVAELWERTLDRTDVDPEKIATAIKHSYEVAVAVTYPEGGGEPQLVGFARAMSDGAFVATICDVAIMPEWQGKGHGLKLVRYLLSRMREGNQVDDVGPSSFAVFPNPAQREFFFKCGFRLSHRFIMMKFMDDSAPEMSADALRPSVQLILAENGKIVADLGDESTLEVQV
uniref:N-acetyltransferase domain-containing protein n=1 Tax=Pyramimonas obovata TaxID=1411642 RepID=A0A7S0WWI8_9CHLO|mmetsp:Transcript_7082/g.14296  ORF Transcript_7082/g.14296 Transcript_7082/m.14296 type:complete len:311 (+) Transcript_7082:65-997(+)|eukprot:CAMPEP_0118926584 /NCGR_PEP_ID=MMETSP1169-20130426/4234_1 /TAXON_ID=36882 /ORGANISM="Pyramimonas obovata, Strain CCMP722" /LENGTH=310 /DNA_ID=CAMNT_0006868159 /DNA_START=58 /DNA_END=990 /DNA_ORIENTATION=-